MKPEDQLEVEKFLWRMDFINDWLYKRDRDRIWHMFLDVPTIRTLYRLEKFL